MKMGCFSHLEKSVYLRCASHARAIMAANREKRRKRKKMVISGCIIGLYLGGFGHL